MYSMEVLFGITLFFLGAVSASFLTVLAERVYTGQSWVRGRSRCNSCTTLLAETDLVPVLSWIFLRGRARCCGARLPEVYVLGEATLGLLFLFAYLHLGSTLLLPVFLLLLGILTFIVLYDLRHTLVPDIATWLLLATAVVYAVMAYGGTSALAPTFLYAGIIGFVFFLCNALSGGRLMGLADSPIALALALVVGHSLALPGLLFSFWIGALVGIVILVRRPKGHRIGIEVPFVPFLAAGYLLAFFTQWNPLVITL